MPLPYTPNPFVGDTLQAGRGSRRGRPMLFQITDPIGRPIFGYVLALHTNPESFGEKFTKSKNVVMTYGGFVEFIWPDELDTISASHTTGGFLGPFSGLTAGSEGIANPNDKDGLYVRAGEHGRHGTMAWERQEDLLDTFRCNGLIFNGEGQPALRGRVMCMYDRGVYLGHFTTFEVAENDDKPWLFSLSWEFKIEESIYNFPLSINQPNFAKPLNPDLQAIQEMEASKAIQPTAQVPTPPPVTPENKVVDMPPGYASLEQGPGYVGPDII